MTQKISEKDVSNLGRTEIYDALADHFNIAAEDIAQSFAPRHTEVLRSVLATAVAARETEKTFLMTGAGVTGLAVLCLANPLLSLSCGAAATFGLYAAQRLSRAKLEKEFVHCVQALENGRPKKPPMP